MPTNQLSDEQLLDLDDKQKEGIINGKTSVFTPPNDCPFARFDQNARSTNRSGSDFFRATNTLFVRNGPEPDCDCQIAFPTTNTSYRFVFGTTNRMRNLLDRTDIRGFGGTVLRRVVASGGSAGSYVLLGSGRVGFRFGANYGSCNEAARDLVLSRIPRQ